MFQRCIDNTDPKTNGSYYLYRIALFNSLLTQYIYWKEDSLQNPLIQDHSDNLVLCQNQLDSLNRDYPDSQDVKMGTLI